MTLPNNIAKALKEKRLVIGKSTTLKALMSGMLTDLFVAANCRAEVVTRMNSISAKTKVTRLDESSDEFGADLKKPFAVLIAGIKSK